MADDENSQNSRKRGALNQINKDNPDPDEDSPEQELGTFKKASEEVMATRRIVKVRRHQQPAAPTASANPFSKIQLISPSESGAKSNDTEIVNKDNGMDNSVSKENDSNPVIANQELGSKSGLVDGTGKVIKPAESILNAELSREDSVREVEDDAAVESTEGTVNAEVEDNGKKTVEAEKDEIESKVANDGQEEHAGSQKDPEKTVGDEACQKNGAAEEENGDGKDKCAQSVSSFAQLSHRQNAFSGLAPGVGLSGSPFSFGAVTKDGASPFSFGLSSFSSGSGANEGSAFTSGPHFGLKTDSSSLAAYNFGSAKNGSAPASASLGDSTDASKEHKVSMQEVQFETGEENEEAAFTADAALYEYSDGGWKERGKGELKLNVSVTHGGKSRLVMRTKGNLRLILNAGLFPDMSLKDMDKRGVTFACVNTAMEGHSGLGTFALKFKDVGLRQEFTAAVDAHKGKKESNPSNATEDSPSAAPVDV